ncbi:YbcC family protein [Salinarimonas sp. NSM]|uniref:YbcC family protein n=1 Tax=Salinarimonas sp. NSM TaxID=3458003 RepID=UPI0040353B56
MTKTTTADLSAGKAALARAEAVEARETPVSLASLEADVATACGRIAPLWPLKHFVAVNPYLGLTEQSFAEAATTLARVSGARMTLPRSHYAARHAAGAIGDADLAEALRAAGAGKQAGVPADLAALKAKMAQDAPPRPLALTAAEAIDAATGRDPAVGAAALVVEEISKTCARVFDEGQALWRAPFLERGLYAAWRAHAAFDRTPEVMGFPGFRRALATLPEDADGAIAAAVSALGVPEAARADYLHRALATINGWASYARYIVWNAELHGGGDPVLKELLAIRLSYDAALLSVTPQAKAAWGEALARMSAPRTLDPERVVDAILQDAAEISRRRGLVARIVEANRSRDGAPAASERPAVQAAFCIDVRSEVFRRALETVAPDVQTIGFAGFFGLSIEYVPFGRRKGGAQCPVLLKPAFVVCEEVGGAGAGENAEIAGRRRLRQEAAKAWKTFKQSAVSSFAYVEAAGLLFAGKLVGDTLGRTRPVTHPAVDGLDAAAAARLGPTLAGSEIDGRLSGIPVEQRIATAQVVLKAMSMTGPFARLIVLAGHGSSTVNNPHASGLDCGACGGHTGEANARVTTAILNDPAVRAALKEAGRGLPDDTWFVPALHDTTTDEVRLYDTRILPASHAGDLARLEAQLAQAGALTRLERAALLALDAPGADVDRQVLARSKDWSQVRPEWGLAGCAAFVAAPRARTRGVDLGGRSFLHDYEWQADEGFGILELIMTAPMVVASWISLQYYGSSVDNRAFGSGNKVLHNVVGGLGVLEGNGGDLKVGLPLQSVHDGARLVHEPLRLDVFVEAPIEEMNRVIAKHDGVRRLVDNGWLRLLQLDDEGRTVRRYVGGLAWETLDA